MRMRDLFAAALLILLAVVGGSFLQASLTTQAPVPPVEPEVEMTSAPLHDHEEPAYTSDLVIMEPSECQATALANVIPRLSGAGSVTWVWAALPATPRGTKAAGYAYADHNAVSLSVQDLPCEWVPSVAMHEWMHLATWETYGEYPEAIEHGESVTELIADCGSQVLGERFGYPTYTNYADRAGGCSEAVLDHVAHILETV